MVGLRIRRRGRSVSSGSQDPDESLRAPHLQPSRPWELAGSGPRHMRRSGGQPATPQGQRRSRSRGFEWLCWDGGVPKRPTLRTHQELRLGSQHKQPVEVRCMSAWWYPRLPGTRLLTEAGTSPRKCRSGRRAYLLVSSLVLVADSMLSCPSALRWYGPVCITWARFSIISNQLCGSDRGYNYIPDQTKVTKFRRPLALERHGGARGDGALGCSRSLVLGVVHLQGLQPTGFRAVELDLDGGPE